MQCGYASKAEQQNHLFTDSLGGKPYLQEPCTVPFCPNCLSEMYLIVQFQTRLKAYNRYSYLFGCNKLKCMAYQTSFKAYRYIVPLDGEIHDVANRKLVAHSSSLFNVDSWDEEIEDSFQGFRVFQDSSPGNIFAKGKTSRNKFVLAETVIHFEHFALEFATSVSKEVDLSHEAKLLDCYNKENQAQSDAELLCNYDWMEEKYESSGLISKYFTKFVDYLGADPERCILYNFKGNPLWYSQPLQVPACKCGSDRVYEFQVLPYTLRLFGIKDSLSLEDGMDFGTVIVYVCAEDCDNENDGWVEEAVILQGEFTPL